MKIDPKPGTARRPVRATAQSIERANVDESARRQWPTCPKARAERIAPTTRKLRLPAVRSML